MESFIVVVMACLGAVTVVVVAITSWSICSDLNAMKRGAKETEKEFMELLKNMKRRYEVDPKGDLWLGVPDAVKIYEERAAGLATKETPPKGDD